MTLDEAIAQVERELPGWWWKVGTCCVSDDACIAPDFNSPIHGERLKREFFPVLAGSELDVGFDVDQRPPGDVAGALLKALDDAKAYLAAHAGSLSRVGISEIPDNILKTARAVVADICGDARMTLMGDVDKMAQPIARALLAESERCAEIIEHRPLAIPDRQELAAYIRSGRYSIHSPNRAAAAIRSQPDTQEGK